MIIDPLSSPFLNPSPRDDTGSDDATSVPLDAQSPEEVRSFDSAAVASAAPPDAYRPQADFGQPISLESGPEPTGDATALAAEAQVRATESQAPPLIAAADDEARPTFPEPRIERPLTVRIRQGMPSYFEPDPDIAGVVGRATGARR